jgi:predicted nucleic acid-binding protein
MSTTPPPPTFPRVVLDTNVALDWLVFRNPASAQVGQAIEQNSIHWIASTDLRDELAHVIARGVVDAWDPDLDAMWRTWDQLARLEPQPAASLQPRLRCTDPDDQKFVDLALCRANYLISRDRAVLKLARRASPLGLRILRPEQWPLAVGSTIT